MRVFFVFVHNLFAAIIFLWAFNVTFASRFYSIKGLNRFHNLERYECLPYFGKLIGGSHYMYLTLSISL